MKWTDVYEIAIELAELHPEAAPQYVNFVELRAWICGLADFSDDPARGGEKVLEAIQAAWIDEIID